jgi:hypothetical protein
MSCLYSGELTKAFIISELMELTNDEECTVRLAAIETVANLLQLLDDGKFYYIDINWSVFPTSLSLIFTC